MRRSAVLPGALSLAALLTAAALGPRDDGSPAALGGLSERAARIALRMSPLPPPPPDPTNAVADDPRAARLGQWLFFDPALSANGAASCASCHDPARSLSDGRPVSLGLREGRRRTPSLWNATHQELFFWDGRADSLWAQALQPLEDEAEMGGSRVDVARRVAEHAELAAAFEALFGPLPDLADREAFPAGAKPPPAGAKPPPAGAKPPPAGAKPPPAGAKPPPGAAGAARETAAGAAWAAMDPADRAAVDRVFVGVGKALGAYQRQLVRGDAPFDRFVHGLRTGDPESLAALPDDARRGFELFVGRAGCRTCHHGPTFQDGAFHDLMLPGPDGGLPGDAGRYEGRLRLAADPFNAASTHSDERDGPAARRLAAAVGAGPSGAGFGEFKTPSLRNVAERAPFMHRGHFASLEDVLHYYSTLEGAVRAHTHGGTVLRALDLDAGEQRDLVAFLRALTGSPPEPSLLAPPPSPLAPR